MDEANTIVSKSLSEDINLSVPMAMAEMPNWVAWKRELTSDGKTTKVPYVAGTNRKASSTNPNDWNTFDGIPQDGKGGAGFVFSGNGICGIDLDHCITDGKVSEEFRPILDAFPSYTEISPSGEGLHIIIKCPTEPFPTGKKCGAVEFYYKGRFFTVTGKQFGNITEVVEFPVEHVRAHLGKYFREPETKMPPKHTAVSTTIDDNEIIGIASNATNGDKFSELMDGYTGRYANDESRADLAFASMLAFYTTDATQIERIMRNSALYRKKWDDNKHYLQRTISAAISGCAEHYKKPEHCEDGVFGRLLATTPIAPNNDNSKPSVSAILKDNDAPIIEEKQDESFETEESLAAKVSRIPLNVRTIPGVLQHAVDNYNANSPRVQPIFAVMSAIAIGSVVLSRRLCSSRWRNFTSLYLAVIGKSGWGKEFIKQYIEMVLAAAARDNLLGGEMYKSATAVQTALVHKPSHITVVDEFGRNLKSGRDNHHQSEAFTALMGLWGRLDGVQRAAPTAESGLSPEQIERLHARDVYRPGITLVMLTTPETFYEGVGSGSLSDGFLARFLPFETDIGKQHLDWKETERTAVPQPLISWIKKYCPVIDKPLVEEKKNTDKGKNGENIVLNEAPLPHQTIPRETILPISVEAQAIFRENEVAISKFESGLSPRMRDVSNRLNEMAMRLSVIVACSCESATINEDHARWAVEFIRYCYQNVYLRLEGCVGDSEFELASRNVVEFVKKQKDNENGGWVLRRRIRDSCYRFQKSDKADLILKLLVSADVLEVQTLPAKNKRLVEAYRYIDVSNHSGMEKG